MDPDACFARYLKAHLENDSDERKEAANDLRTWLRYGGFPPKWTASQKADFFHYVGQIDL